MEEKNSCEVFFEFPLHCRVSGIDCMSVKGHIESTTDDIGVIKDTGILQ
jgi:hypothetical protein